VNRGLGSLPCGGSGKEETEVIKAGEKAGVEVVRPGRHRETEAQERQGSLCLKRHRKGGGLGTFEGKIGSKSRALPGGRYIGDLKEKARPNRRRGGGPLVGLRVTGIE